MRIQFFLLSFCLLFLTSCRTPAQITAPVEKIEGKSYYMHTVEKGQTLYSLSKLYRCDINDILSANPGTDTGIKENQTIKIPVSKSKSDVVPVLTAADGSYLMHEVKKKETLFSISQLYKTDINAIASANPGSDQGIKKGQMLKIPLKKKADDNLRKHIVQKSETLYSISKTYGITVDDLVKANPGLTESLKEGYMLTIPATVTLPPIADPSDNITKIPGEVTIIGQVFQEKYSIALMLPFFSSFNDSLGLKEKDRKLRDVALNMYRGALVGVDSLQNFGFNADLYIYDILDGITMVNTAIAKPEMKEMDLIIGPTYRDPLNELTRWATKHGVHVVCPVQQSNSVLLSSPNMSKAWSSSVSQWETIAQFIFEKHADDNVILVNTKNTDDKKRVDAFRNKFLQLKGDTVMTEVTVLSGSLYGVRDKLSTSKKNIVIAPTNDRTMINSLLKGLSSTENTILFGTDEWENLELIEAKDRNRLHLHYPKVVAVDYNSDRVREWILAYRRKFKSEPTEYAFLGFDMMMYYCQGIQKFGIAFPNHFAEMNQAGLLGSGFTYTKTSDESGFENSHVFILGTDDFEVTLKN
ncbi:MAG: LysM peptidoglycan-binding domain-containing protein [Flavobacteriales bacterium]|nr:LysM peptidoglycan-binding domain-containing protein [Flavobacteriales bacterium]